jgi:hypothetical protein
LAEAVDVLGVPSDLVKVLKTYHNFFEERQRGKKHGSDTGKGKVAARSFLNKLSTMVSKSLRDVYLMLKTKNILNLRFS